MVLKPPKVPCNRSITTQLFSELSLKSEMTCSGVHVIYFPYGWTRNIYNRSYNGFWGN